MSSCSHRSKEKFKTTSFSFTVPPKDGEGTPRRGCWEAAPPRPAPPAAMALAEEALRKQLGKVRAGPAAVQPPAREGRGLRAGGRRRRKKKQRCGKCRVSRRGGGDGTGRGGACGEGDAVCGGPGRRKPPRVGGRGVGKGGAEGTNGPAALPVPAGSAEPPLVSWSSLVTGSGPSRGAGLRCLPAAAFRVAARRILFLWSRTQNHVLRAIKTLPCLKSYSFPWGFSCDTPAL